MKYEVLEQKPWMVEEGGQDLRERTKIYALRVIRLYSSLPKTTEAQVIGKQLLRSGTSVGANYREAYRARSTAEFIAKCGISLQELEETTYWLELLVEAEITPKQKLSNLLDETSQLIAILTTISKKAKANPQ
jgi:four helix bundle protein